MSRLISLSTVTLALLLIAPMTLEAGPRGGGGRGGAGGGGGGGARGGGGERPNMGGGNFGGGNFGGGNLGGGNFSGAQQGDRSGFGGGNGPAAGGSMGRDGQFGGGDRGQQGFGGNSRLSSALEGGNLEKFGGNGQAGDRNAIGNGRPNNGQLNSFLGIDGGRGNVDPAQRDANPANRDLNNRGDLTDRNLNVDDRNLNVDNRNLDNRNIDNRKVDNRNVDVRQNNTNILNNKNINNVNVNNNHVNVDARGGQIYNNMNGYWNNGPRPFSKGWYGAHPGAWNYRYPGGNAWAAASFGAVTGWMIGASTTPTSYVYSNSYYYPAGTTVDDQQAYAAQQATDASQLASSAPQPTADDGEQWMPLGVYAIVDGQDATSSKMLLQLAVSKSGNLAGTYYHAQTGNSQTVHGAVDLKTQQVAWQIGDNTSVTFQTDLESLTKAETPVLVHYASGQSEQVEMVRMPDEDASKS